MKNKLTLLSFLLFLSACGKKGTEAIVTPVTHDSIQKASAVVQMSSYPRSEIYTGKMTAYWEISQCPPEAYSDTEAEFQMYVSYINADSVVFWSPSLVTLNFQDPNGYYFTFAIAGASATRPDNTYTFTHTLGATTFTLTNEGLYVQWSYEYYQFSYGDGPFSGNFSGKLNKTR